MQNAIPEIAKMMKTLCAAVEVNKDYYLKTSFYTKQANPAVDENLLRSFFVERIYGIFGTNPEYFTEMQPFQWAKAWLRSVIQKILESRSFQNLSALENAGKRNSSTKKTDLPSSILRPIKKQSYKMYLT